MASTHQQQDPLTYESTGVSITAGNSLVNRIQPIVKSTARPGSTASIGGFGGVFSLRDAGFGPDAPDIVTAIDGVGTKLLVATAARDVSTVGIDLVAMNVNDLVVQGATPLKFVDYYSCSKLDVDAATGFVEGVAEGCRRARCVLAGGETAEMPGVYNVEEGHFDAAGCAIGAIKAGRRILPAKDSMHEGDVLLGLTSSGPHSNGFSLIRKILERQGLKYSDPVPWSSSSTSAPSSTSTTTTTPQTLGNALLIPTRIYVRSILAALDLSESHMASSRQRDPGTNPNPLIKGLAHITGGGLYENIPRMLPPHLKAHLDARTWARHVPELLRWLKRAGRLADGEFARTLNAGVGMVMVVGMDAEGEGENEERLRLVEDVLRENGEEVVRIGSLVGAGAGEGEGEEAERVVIQGTEEAWAWW
ncbi:MAG: hypothetical protein M1831_002080 [Alyxoria varia]|nr:MAG: hypothetical protein M1831_002080 [Alyxoria varia]